MQNVAFAVFLCVGPWNSFINSTGDRSFLIANMFLDRKLVGTMLFMYFPLLGLRWRHTIRHYSCRSGLDISYFSIKIHDSTCPAGHTYSFPCWLPSSTAKPWLCSVVCMWFLRLTGTSQCFCTVQHRIRPWTGVILWRIPIWGPT